MKKKIAFALACAAFAAVVSVIDFEPIQSDDQPVIGTPVPPKKSKNLMFASVQSNN